MPINNATSQIRSRATLAYLDITAAAGASIELPVSSLDELAVYVCSGSVTVAGVEVKKHDLAKLSMGNFIEMTASENAKLVVIGGETASRSDRDLLEFRHRHHRPSERGDDRLGRRQVSRSDQVPQDRIGRQQWRSGKNEAFLTR
ncbi:hypothetical protein BH24ACI3_BH24ACI3_05320 [soil metagenome]